MPDTAPSKDFLRQIVDRDLRDGRYDEVVTRFPPEPNGYPHIGHAKSIVLNFGIADERGGRTHLRFDDTNPTTEDTRYVEAIEEAIRWLGYEWDALYHASDYFEKLYDFAEGLIRKGKAYVDSQSEEEIRENRGTVTEPGRPSPHRERTVEENLDLFRRMRAGEFEDGTHVLRAKIDMAHPNMIMRDPLLYRIRHVPHYRRGDDWVIYPLYDYAHGLSDAIEGITHSFCTLEFENNREIYDWLLDEVGFEEPRPHQYEFARLNLDYTVMSKRMLKRLVDEGRVAGWDDPRMPTLAGFRRRGYTPEAIRAFCEMIGVARADSRVDMGKLEYAIRDDLNRRAPRVMAVLDPLPVTLVNWPPPGLEGDFEIVELAPFPDDVAGEVVGKAAKSAVTRRVPLDRRILIERDDFAEHPPKGFRRLVPGGEVWLKGAYAIRCDEVVKDAEGEISELRCSVDFEARAGRTADGRRIRGTVHWASEAHGVPLRVRLYDRLFSVPEPEAADDFTEALNPRSLEDGEAIGEPGLSDVSPGTHLQFERVGYFFADPEDSRPGAPAFNRTVTLRDSWAKVSGKGGAGELVREAREAEGAARRGSDATAARESGSHSAPPTPRFDPDAAAVEAGGDVLLRYRRFTEFGLDGEDALTLASDEGLARFFDDAVATHDDPTAVANWVVNELARVSKERSLATLPFGGRQLGHLVALLAEGRVSGPAAKVVFETLVAEGGDPEAIVADRGLERVADEGALAPVVDAIVAANPEEVEAYREGKTGLIGFFIGAVMRETGGTADPQVARSLLEERLAEE